VKRQGKRREDVREGVAEHRPRGERGRGRVTEARRGGQVEEGRYRGGGDGNRRGRREGGERIQRKR